MGGKRRQVHRRGAGRPPRTGAYDLRGQRRSSGRARTFFCALFGLLILAVAVFAVPSALRSGEGNSSSASPEATVPDDAPARSGKLAGAVETVDENGIVRGTTQGGANYLLWSRDEAALSPDKVTLVAAGDQIGTDQVLALAAAYGEAEGAGAYDFRPFYQEVKPFIQSFDLRFVNQETVMAGSEEYGYSGYPSFNTPDAAAEALDDAGFNMVNLATNHVLDYGTSLAERSLGVWRASHPHMLTAGSYAGQHDRETVRMIERNGMTFAFLAFCYGDNYYQQDLPDTWHLAGFDKAALEADVRRAQEVADAVIVAMHWGTEYQSEPNEQQLDYAQFLADLGVDLVLGTHAHTVQPVRYVTGSSGNTVPVVFGLSDFVSGWTVTDCILSGLFTCDFVRVYDEGAQAGEVVEDAGSAQGAAAGEQLSWHVEVRNLAWHPTIEWSEGGQVYVRFLKDMDLATTNANTRTPDVEDDYAYVREKMSSLGMEIPIDW